MFFGFLLCTGFCFGQDVPDRSESKEVIIDLDKRSISEDLPFDRYFDIKLKGNNLRLRPNIHIWRVKYIGDSVRVPLAFKKKIKKSLKESNEKTEKKTEEKTGEEDLSQEISNLKKDASKRNYISKKINFKTNTINDVPPLLPNNLYEIIFLNYLTDKQLSTLYKIVEEYDSDIEKALKIYEKEFKSVDEGRRYIVPHQSMPSYSSIHQKNLKDTISKYENVPIISFSPISANVILSSIGSLMANNDLKIDSYSLMTLELMDNESNLDELILGLRKIGEKKKAELHQYIERHQILTYNKSFLDSVAVDLKKLISIDNTTLAFNFYNSDFKELYKAIDDNLQHIEKLNGAIKKYCESIFNYTIAINTNTFSDKIKERNAQYLVTDFGWLNAFPKNNNGDIKYIGRPYLGVNWHFGGIDKDQDLDKIVNKNFWRHNFSLAIGITIGKIDEGDFEDLFNGLSPSIGCNIRFSKQVRFGFGGLLLRERDVNPILDRKPVEVAPYFNLTVDLSLSEQLGKIVGITK